MRIERCCPTHVRPLREINLAHRDCVLACPGAQNDPSSAHEAREWVRMDLDTGKALDRVPIRLAGTWSATGRLTPSVLEAIFTP